MYSVPNTSTGKPRKASVVALIWLSPYTVTSSRAVIRTPLFSTTFEVLTMAFAGSTTVVMAPGVTEKLAVKANPGTVTVPVVATSPVMNKLRLDPVLEVF